MQVHSLVNEHPGHSSKKHPPKSVSFELLLDEKSKTRARIPLRVLVNNHDTTDSIITTVKNFYGIYDGNGISFEDSQGNTLIASYDNLNHETIVYVRSVAGASHATASFSHGSHILGSAQEPQRRPSLGEPFQMVPPHLREHSLSPTRSSPRLANARSVSPHQGRGRRSQSQHKNGSFPGSRGSSTNGSVHDDNGYSDSEGGRSSVSGSRKARSEQFASSDISTANVLQDGRRGQPIFDSSTLPLFAPPQVPVTASQSSISPQRRSVPHEGPSPFHLPARKFDGVNAPVMVSPNGLEHPGQDRAAFPKNSHSSSTPAQQHGHRLRDRSTMHTSTPYAQGIGYSGSGVLPTPDPTVASCISDEDVARTLIALGDASNFSHGRTSNSTLDDTFSGVADAVSSTGATSDSDEYSDSERGLPKHRKYLDVEDDDEYENEAVIKSEFDEYDGPPKTKKIKTKQYDGPSTGWKPPSMGMKTSKSNKIRANTLPKVSKANHQGLLKVSTAPAMLSPARKESNTSANSHLPLGPDEDDLSSKPRCQRCRKSKKGCDRQRPCGRCIDAGIGIEGCVSEDEGNGKKGRYGRHMGVPITKAAEISLNTNLGLEYPVAKSTEGFNGVGGGDKSKKRKR